MLIYKYVSNPKVLSLVIVAMTRLGGGDFHDSQIFVPPAPQVSITMGGN